ncbi:hypothetical protein D3C77_623730 [compost metagenome]
MRVLDLRIGVPEFRPFPGFLEEAPGDAPQGVALHHGVPLRMVVLQLHSGLGDTAHRHQQQGE